MKPRPIHKNSAPFTGLFFNAPSIAAATTIKRLNDPISDSIILSQYDLSPDDKLYQNLFLACSIVNQVRAVLNTSTTHPDANSLSSSSAKIANIKLKTVRLISTLTSVLIEPLMGLSYGDGMSRRVAEFIGAGNCYEYSHVALHKLRNHDPSINAEVYSIKNGDHIFLLIDRDSSSDPSDLNTWGKNAVVCDAWAGDVFPADEIPHKLMDYKQSYVSGVRKNELVHYSDRQGLMPHDSLEDRSFSYKEKIPILIIMLVCLIKAINFYLDIGNTESSDVSRMQP